MGGVEGAEGAFVELVFDLEMVDQFAGVLVVEAVAGVEADGVDVASNAGAVFDPKNGNG